MVVTGHASYPAFMRAEDDESKLLYERIQHLQSRWHLQCVLLRKQEAMPAINRVKVAENPKYTTYEIVTPPELEEQTVLIKRFAHDPGFWQFVERSTTVRGSGKHHRGRRFEHSRQAHLELLLRILVNGSISHQDLETTTVTSRHLFDLLNKRVGERRYHIFRNGLGEPTKAWKVDMRIKARTPYLVAGPLSPDESKQLFTARWEGDDGQPAASLSQHLLDDMSGLGPWGAPDYATSILRFRNKCLEFLATDERLRDQAVAQRLRVILAPQWWVLHKLYLFASIDTVLDWFYGHSPGRRRDILADKYPVKWRAGRVLDTWKKIGRGAGQGHAMAAIVSVAWLEVATRMVGRLNQERDEASAHAIWQFLIDHSHTPVVRATAALNLHGAIRSNHPMVAKRVLGRACDEAEHANDGRLQQAIMDAELNAGGQPPAMRRDAIPSLQRLWWLTEPPLNSGLVSKGGDKIGKKGSGKAPMTKEAASRIQSSQAKGGKPTGKGSFSAKAQKAADKNQ